MRLQSIVLNAIFLIIVFAAPPVAAKDGIQATVPTDGVARIEIGIAGTMTDAEGRSERSDWIFPQANDPIEN